MKKGEIYEGKVTEVNFPNKGKVECENGTVTVKNVIPGQNIRFMINKKRFRPKRGVPLGRILGEVA